MSLVLHVDGERWRTHLRRTAERFPGLVPVAKGNGYGFGLSRLARRAQWLGVDTLAVGLYEELDEVHQRFDGSMLVLSPWRPFQRSPSDLGIDEDRVIHTVTRLVDLELLAARGAEQGHRPRVVLERRTSMQRHGLEAGDLARAAELLRAGGVRLEGVALHLPLAPVRPALSVAKASHVHEVEDLLGDPALRRLLGQAAQEGGSAAGGQAWVSHLSESELEILTLKFPQLRIRPRVGTALWLGDREAMRVTATVLDTHRVQRGDTYGYRQRSAPRRGTLLVVSGGTSHGIGLEAPTGEDTLKARAASIARGSLDAAGFVRSPFSIGHKQRLFAEPPHMQVSMLFIPHGARVPEVGDELDVRVRYTATTFDRVEVD